MRVPLTVLCLLFLWAPAQAFTPESGWWWNPDEPGRGYNIEIQDDVLTIAAYGYDADGFPVWFTAAAQMIGNERVEAEFDYFEAPALAGDCLACPYAGQPFDFLGEGGLLDIEFIDTITARLTWDGGDMIIERFNFALGDLIQRMRGEWQLVLDFSDEPDVFPYSGEVLVLDRVLSDSGGRFADGCRPANTEVGACSDNPTRPAAGEFDGDFHVIAVDDSVDTWAVYYLNMGLDKVSGVVEVYDKQTGNGQGIFYPVRGHRTASRAFVNTGIGPSKEGPRLSGSDAASRPGLGEFLGKRLTLGEASRVPGSTPEALSQRLGELRSTAQRLTERLQTAAAAQ